MDQEEIIDIRIRTSSLKNLETSKPGVRLQNICEHIAKIKIEPEPNTPEGCEECLKSGDEWVHLRLCLICGHVGCCDKSKNKHASKHFHNTGHAVIKSLEPGESWRWCYIDKIFL